MADVTHTLPNLHQSLPNAKPGDDLRSYHKEVRDVFSKVWSTLAEMNAENTALKESLAALQKKGQ